MVTEYNIKFNLGELLEIRYALEKRIIQLRSTLAAKDVEMNKNIRTSLTHILAHAETSYIKISKTINADINI